MLPIVSNTIYVIDLEVRPLPNYEEVKFATYDRSEDDENYIEVEEANFFPWTSEIYGISVAWGPNLEKETAYFTNDDISKVLKFLELHQLPLGAHNVLFDWLNSYYHYEVRLNFVSDSGVISQCINNSDTIMSFGLKQTTERQYSVITQDKELKEYLKTVHKISAGKYGKYIHLCPPEMIEKYCRLDSHYCWRLIHDSPKWLKSDISVYMQLYINEVRMTIQQFLHGIKIDKEGFIREQIILQNKIESIKNDFFAEPTLAKHIDEIKHKHYELYISERKKNIPSWEVWSNNADNKFNINSGKQLKELFDAQKLHWNEDQQRFNYPYVNTFPNTKINNPNSPKLGTKFIHEYGIGGKILGDLGEKKTLLSHIDRALDEARLTGRIHPHINLLGTASGRISASGVNIVATPIGDKEYGKNLIADDGWVILCKDFKSLEPTILACLSGDPILQYITYYGEGKEPFIKDDVLWIDDMYTSVAYSATFMRPQLMNVLDLTNWVKNPDIEREKYKPLRKSSKTMCLSTIYGAGPIKVQQRLREEVKIYEPLPNIIAFQKAYWSTFATASQYKRDRELEAKTNGYFINAGGFPLIFYDKPGGVITGTHKALNRDIQSTAAFVMKLLLYYVYRRIKDRHDVIPAVADWHDAIWAYVRAEAVDEINGLIEEALVEVNKTLNWPLKLRLDKNIGDSFYACK